MNKIPATHGTTQHLSETELEFCLIGDAAPEATAHLAACEACTAALAEMEAPLESFRAVTMAWAERRSATLPLNDLAVAQRRAAAGWRQRMAVSACLTAALAVGVAVPVLHRAKVADTPAAQSAQSSAPVPEAHASAVAAVVPAAHTAEGAGTGLRESPAQQIRRDNQMLLAIDQELDSRVESPAALGLLPAPARTPVPSQMQD